MAKEKLKQIKLTSGETSTQPPFPGGWVLAIFDAAHTFAPFLATKHRLPISQSTKDRINRAEEVKLSSYGEIEAKLVEVIAVMFPAVSAVNGFAQKYVNDYFRTWKPAAEFAPKLARNYGFKTNDSNVIGRALARDLLLRLCYLESCERRLSNRPFTESELALLKHDSPAQIYHALITERLRARINTREKLTARLQLSEKSLRRFELGASLPQLTPLLKLTLDESCRRVMAGIGLMDHLLKRLGLRESDLQSEFTAIASMFFHHHPPLLATFTGRIPRVAESGITELEDCDFERYAAFGDGLLLHPGFNQLRLEMPDPLWRCHLYTLQFGCFVDLAQAYFQFSNSKNDEHLEEMLAEAERESDGCPYHWMEKLNDRRNPSGR